MNRHHPYTSSFDGPPRRGGPPIHGSERPFRGGGPRGRGRGRGVSHGSSGYNSPTGPTAFAQTPVQDNSYYGAHDNAPPPNYSTQTNGYGAPPHIAPPPSTTSAYGAPPSQTSSYNQPSGYGQTIGYEQNNGYNHTNGYDQKDSYDQKSGYDQKGGYEQTYKGYEDAPRGQYEYSGYTAAPAAPSPRREEGMHEALITDRVNRERPCRTLFIRNIKYETSSDEVRGKFEDHGDVKTFFDLIGSRGMVFVTYFDLRAAERARERLQGSEIAGRPIDVHYSLPRDEAGDKNVERQGTIVVTLQESASNQGIDEYELRRQFQHVGDIKSILPVVGRPDQRYVDFYDLRACDMAMERLRHHPLQDGYMELTYGWAEEDMTTSTRGGRKGRDFDDAPRGRRSRRGRGRGRGGSQHEEERRREQDGDRGGRPRFQDVGPDRGYENANAEPRGPGGYSNPESRGPGGYGGTEPRGTSTYSAPPPPPGRPNGYGPPPSAPAYHEPAPPAAQPDDRLEQARKVQQLLAALKGTQATAAPAAPSAPPPNGSAPGYYGQATSTASSGYPPPAAYSAPPPAATSFGATPPSMSSLYSGIPQASSAYPPPTSSSYLPSAASSYNDAPSAAPSAYGNAPPPAVPIPANILAMLQGGSASAPPPMLPTTYGGPANHPTQQPGPGQPSYEQLMAMFQNQAAAARR